MSAETVEIEAEVKRETPNALLLYDGKAQVWVPKSQVVTGIHNGDYREGYIYTISIPEWLAHSKGLI